MYTFVLTILFALLTVSPPASVSVTVNVSGARSDDGQIVVMLFNDDDGFPRDVEKAFRTVPAALEGSTATVEIEEVPTGTYAVAAFHDADSDGRIKTNWVGMPREGVAITNYSGGRPKFDASAVEIGPGTNTTIDLTLRYR